jgi:transcriptional regulator with XRE-family HTH domain
MTEQRHWDEDWSERYDRLIERHGNDVAGLRRAAGREDWDHLAQAIRGARQAEGISQSELARRAGVSASVISRIESGLVKGPGERTTRRVAAALGRSGTVLQHIVAGSTHEASLELDIPVLREARAEYDAEMSSDKEDVDDGGIIWKWEPAVMDALVAHFVATMGIDDLPTDHMEQDSRWAVEQFARKWPELTERRKELVLEFLVDQVTLSRHDTRPKKVTL